MPPAKSDLAAWYQLHGANAEQKGSVKLACIACRAAKIRCLRDDRNGACSRCIRLGLDCCVKAHQKGRKRAKPFFSDSQDESLAFTRSTSSGFSLPLQSCGRAGNSTSNRNVTSSRIASVMRERQLDVHMTSSKRRLQGPIEDFSTSSLFRMGNDHDVTGLCKATMAWQLIQVQSWPIKNTMADETLEDAGATDDLCELDGHDIVTGGLFTEDELQIAVKL